ncbi:VHS-domain-containing protein, partial [Backusella circina FSU 941]
FSPRDASQAIVRLINSTKINQAMLALTLLDNCVKNCGYPFHLQIASKEFLNALVSKFPERPPGRYAPNPSMPTPVIDRILYLIKEWKIALTELSRYQDDMMNIKDMYRLLKFKGKRFPELRDSSIAALAPDETLKSEQEIEKEDRLAKSAKLQELIRRGRPQDLVEANELMKVMSGYDQRHQTNYNEIFKEELQKIQNKARLLYEMLENVKKGDAIEGDATIQELKNSCESAVQKINNMLKGEENKSKIGVLLKYGDVKSGKFETEYDISGKYQGDDNEQISNSSGIQQQQAISLIDLDDHDIPSDSSGVSPQPSHAIIDDLNEIFGITGNNSSNNIGSVGRPSKALGASSSYTDPFDLLTQNIQSTSISSPPKQQQELDIFASSPSISTSSLPTSPEIRVQEPSKNIQLVNKNGLVITLEQTGSRENIKLQAYYSNVSTAPMENMNLLLAAPKAMHLKMESATSHLIPTKSDKSVSQLISIHNPKKEPLRLRYKVTYDQFGVQMEQTGDYRE